MRLRKLLESSRNEVAIIFGRFNPPHKGHRAAWEMASQSPIWYVGTNEGTVGPKDPLPFDVKVEAMKTVWPKVANHIVAETSWLTLASKVYKDHGNVTLLCLTDEDWVTKTLVQYNGKEGAHGFYNFPNIQQKTTPRLSSATALRDAVVKGDRAAFTAAAGVDAETKVAGKAFFDLVAEYLLPYQNAPVKKPAKKKEPAVTEGVAETLPMQDAVKVLKHYGAEHFKTTSNELHFYKNGRGLSVDLVMNSDTTRSVTLSSLNSATRRLKGQGVAEGSEERSQNALWAQITAHEKAAKKSKDLKQQHHLKMADQLRSQLKTSDEQGVAEGSAGVSVKKWANQIRKDHGTDIKFVNRKEGGGAVDMIRAINSQGETVGVYNRKTGYPTVFEPKQGVAEGAPIVVMPRADRLKKAEPTKVRYQGDIVPPTKPPSTEKRGVKGRPGQRPMPEQGVAEGDVVQFPKKHKGDLSDTHDCPKCGGDLQGGKYMGHQVKVCMPCKQVYLPPNSGIDQKGNKITDEATSDAIANAAKRLTDPNDGKTTKLRAAGDKRREEHLKSRDIAKKNEAVLAGSAKRPARAGSRPPRGHSTVTTEHGDQDNYDPYGYNDKRNASTTQPLDASLRRYMIKKLAKAMSWGTSDLELLKDDELEGLYFKHVPGAGDMAKQLGMHVDQILAKRSFKKEDAAGVGIITKQNTTKDVNKGTLRKMMKAYHLLDSIEPHVAEAEGDPEGVPHLTKELLQNIVQQVGTQGAHAIVKSLQWGDGASKELLHLIVKDLEQDIEQGVVEGIMNTIANKVMGTAPEQPKYKVGQRVKYETNPHQPDWKDGGRGTGVITAYKNGHYMINGNPVNHFEIKGVAEAVSRRGFLKGLGAAALGAAAGDASAIAGAFPSPSTREKWAKDAAASNAAEAKRLAAKKAKADADRLAVNTPDVDRLNKVNYHGKNAPTPSNATWDGDSDFLDLDGTQYSMASRMPISGDVPPNMKLIVTKEGRQVYIWTRNSLKGVHGRYFYPANVGESISEAPIEMDPAEPMNPMIYGAGANPAKLKDRMMRASGQLNDLATRAAAASPAEWQRIAANFDELTMNIEQIRHAMAELAKRRKRGGIGSRGIDKNIG